MSDIVQFRAKPCVVTAVQVTDATFEGPHPNPAHLPSENITYNPKRHCAFVVGERGTERANVGDWITMDEWERLRVFDNNTFKLLYERM